MMIIRIDCGLSSSKDHNMKVAVGMGNKIFLKSKCVIHILTQYW